MMIDQMLWDERYKEALAYFTKPRHVDSFQIWEGSGNVLVSAPHAVTQMRDGKIKCAERYTGVLARLLYLQTNCHCFVKTKNMQDDANRDIQSSYRQSLNAYLNEHHIAYLLDLHQLSPKRSMALCLMTGHGKHLKNDLQVVSSIKQIFENHQLSPVVVDDPFSGDRPHTVVSDAAKHSGAITIGFELNTKLFLEHTEDEHTQSVYESLVQVTQMLSMRSKEE